MLRWLTVKGNAMNRRAECDNFDLKKSQQIVGIEEYASPNSRSPDGDSFPCAVTPFLTVRCTREPGRPTTECVKRIMQKVP
jgi:hypothetical protein